MTLKEYQATIEQLEGDSADKIIIDIRKPEDYARETYPGAENIYVAPAEKEAWEDASEDDEADAKIMELIRPLCDKTETVYLICYTGKQSDRLAEAFFNEGKAVYSIDGGFHSYLRVKLARLMENEEKVVDRAAEAERSIIKTYKKEIWRKFTKAINEYDMIQDGDKIAVCISGGKDSMLMAKLFQELERHGKKNFELVFLVMNPGYNDINYETILNNAKLLNVPITVFKTEIFDTVADITDSPCYLCARMRRGYLYSKAEELGCNKIALGHHFDDVIETIMMSMLYGAQIQSMMPKLHSTNFNGMELIRPLYLIREADIIRWMNFNDLHFIQCACRFTENCASCGGTEKGSKRAEVKALIKELAAKNPYIEMNIFRSMENVNVDTVIEYKKDGKRHHFLDEYAVELARKRKLRDEAIRAAKKNTDEG